VSDYVQNAYPVLLTQPNEAQVKRYYTATSEEWGIARRLAQTADEQLAVLCHLKLHQLLARFIPLADVPRDILEMIVRSVGAQRVPTAAALKRYDASSNSRRHIARLREQRGVKPYTKATEEWLLAIAETAAEIKSDLDEIINVLLEELIRNYYDLPSLDALERIAATAREKVHNAFYRTMASQTSPQLRAAIDKLLEKDDGPSGWSSLKREARQPTNKEVRGYLQHLVRLRDLSAQIPAVPLPVSKRRYFLNIADKNNVHEFRQFRPEKRYTIAALHIRSQFAKALDDAALVFIKLMQAMENLATENLTRHHLDHNERAEKLISQFKDVLEAYADKGTNTRRIRAIAATLEEEPEALIDQCVEHLAYAGKNYLPFLVKPYSTQRSILFNCLDIMRLQSASEDKSMEHMIAALQKCRNMKAVVFDPSILGIDIARDLDWLGQRWRKHVVVEDEVGSGKELLNRKYFELCVLTQIKDDLNSADLFVPGGEKYDDFREQMIDAETLKKELPAYEEASGLPADAHEFIRRVKAQMVEVGDRVDRGFPKNDHARIVDKLIILSPMKRKPLAEAIIDVDAQLTKRMAQTTIIDLLVETTKWLKIQRHFKPVAGTQPRVDDLVRRVVLTLFCYGCNLGPSGTARCVKGLSRKQIAWLNLKYVTEDTLRAAIKDVVNAYNKLELPSYWGSNVSASADGTKWTMRENTIMSEYHIRYGGYGGIGYYVVADTYIAIFSRFIACGSYEGHHILDHLMENESDVRPTMLHGDTHAQNYIAFGLAPFLGAELMPRIRRFKDLKLYRPTPGKKYKHINSLFDGTIEWDLIARHYADILRYVVSIKLGKISPSTILRRFHSNSKKNRVYHALHEIGKAYRTIFLLKYIEDPQLRVTINAATNKSEAFNNFIKWVFFANKGIIDQSVRNEQQKLILYNHLVANMIMYHNAQEMQRVIAELAQEGWEISPEMIGGQAPYRMAHINLHGNHDVDVERPVDGLRAAAQIQLARTLKHDRKPRGEATVH